MVNSYCILDTSGKEYFIRQENYEDLRRDLMNSHPFVTFIAEWDEENKETILMNKEHIVRITEVKY